MDNKCRLTLTIVLAGIKTDYALLILNDDDSSRKIQLRNVTTNETYVVRVSNIGMSCTCPDFKKRHRGRTTGCKHIRALVAQRLLPAL